VIDLNKYCGTNSFRPAFMKPFRTPKGIVATNQHILICVPDDGRQIHNDVGDKYARKIEMWLSEVRTNWIPFQAEIPETTTCNWCEGTGEVDGDEPEDCECAYCDGTGIERGEPIPVGDCHIAQRYARMLRELPNLRVSTDGPSGVIRLQFTGGTGCLMPVKM
jgi:DnaJ-class molecular chaperone